MRYTKIVFIALIMALFSMVAAGSVSATSGACSGHLGVNCAAGAQSDGTVICNDGWLGSSVLYSNMIECSQYSQPVSIYSYNCGTGYVNKGGQCLTYLQDCQSSFGLNVTGIKGTVSNTSRCYCDLGYQWNATKTACEDQNLSNASPETIYQVNVPLCTQGRMPFQQSACIKLNSYCLLRDSNYFWSSISASCECTSGYIMDVTTMKCVRPQINASTESVSTLIPLLNSNSVSTLIPLPATGIYNPSKKDPTLLTRLMGHILLQVQSHGEAWYINPADLTRYYMQDGLAAYSMMRSFGLGIGDSDLKKIPMVLTPQDMLAASSSCSSSTLANRLKGKILLQVQQHGEAWYIDPRKCKAIYMKDGNAAYQIMRYLGLGVTDSDLEKIPN